MMEFLKITRDYAVDPQSRIASMHGTKIHGALQRYAEELHLPAELALSPDGRDVFDLLEWDEREKGWVLTDYKTWGSYKVAKSFGIKKITNGKKPEFVIQPEEADTEEPELQLNHYRVMLERLGLKIVGMQLEILVRDGGIAVARSRGVDFNARLLPIKKLDDEVVNKYFEEKEFALLDALDKWNKDKTYMPRPCTMKESWEHRRCQGFCDVAEFCPIGMIEKGGSSLYNNK